MVVPSQLRGCSRQTCADAVKDTCFVQGLPWLTPIMPREASHHLLIHPFSQRGCLRLRLVGHPEQQFL